MEATPVTGRSEVTGNVMFYRRPEPLNPENHGGLGMKRTATPFAFLSTANIVPLTVAEFGPAALSYPVIFIGENKQPAAVMALRQGDNLFVDASGGFEPDAYLPAFIRRYPFVLANDEHNNRMVVCVDRDADVVGEQPDVPFFQNGQPTEFTQNAVQFCENFETERQRTENFIELLRSMDMFELKTATFTPRNPDGSAGQPQTLAEYFGISEAKIRELPAERLVEFRDNGALQQMYAHLNSLMNWEKLVARAMQRQAASAASAANDGLNLFN